MSGRDWGPAGKPGNLPKDFVDPGDLDTSAVSSPPPGETEPFLPGLDRPGEGPPPVDSAPVGGGYEPFLSGLDKSEEARKDRDDGLQLDDAGDPFHFDDDDDDDEPITDIKNTDLEPFLPGLEQPDLLGNTEAPTPAPTPAPSSWFGPSTTLDEMLRFFERIGMSPAIVFGALAIAFGVTLAVYIFFSPRSQPATEPPAPAAIQIRALRAALVPPITTYEVESLGTAGSFFHFAWSTTATCGAFTSQDSPRATWLHPHSTPPLPGECSEGTVHPGAITVVVTDDKGNSAKITYVGGSATGEVRP